MMNKKIKEIFQESLLVIEKSKRISLEIEECVDLITNCYHNKKKVIIFGNGGSAADSQHFAAELISRYLLERKSIPAVAFTTDTSTVTSIGNDYGFEQIFSRQCESMVSKGDVVIAISTSGKSKNVINGIMTAKKNGALVIGLTGKNDLIFKKFADIVLSVPSNSTPRIQEVHRIIIHIICELVEKELFTKD